MKSNAVRNRATIDAAVVVYGKDAQVAQALEEFGELLTALGHYRRGRCGMPKVAEEAADVSIMLDQLAVIFGQTESNAARQASPPPTDFHAVDAICEAMCKLGTRLMEDRRGECAPLLVVVGIGRAMLCLGILVQVLGISGEFTAARAAKLERLHDRIFAKLSGVGQDGV